MWILWIGALLVVGGSAGLVQGRTALARVLWGLAAMAVVGVLVRGVDPLPGFLDHLARIRRLVGATRGHNGSSQKVGRNPRSGPHLVGARVGPQADPYS